MDFSIIIPSRNRPLLLERALLSVFQQEYSAKEIIVVNDGSDVAYQAQYAQIAAKFSGQVRLHNLERTPHGHGPSYAINRGAEIAQGDFLCFLDDDDCWTDSGHLARAKLVTSAGQVDLYLTNQLAYTGETLILEPLWLQVVAGRIREKYARDAYGAYEVTREDLMTCDSFPHLNNTIARRRLYWEAGGMDEAVRYECEWDLYFRMLDKAQGIKYCPEIVSRHNVPDKAKTLNVSTAVSDMQKLLLRAYVMDKALLFTRSKSIMRVAKRNKMYTLKKVALLLAETGDFDRALLYARQATPFAVNAKWRLYSYYLATRALLNRWK